MRIFKSLKQGLLYRTYPFADRYYLSVSLLSFFDFSDNISKIIPESEGWKYLDTVLSDNQIFDLGMPKQHGELLVAGSFFCRNGTPARVGRIKIQIGSIDKELAIFGNRRWKRPGSAHWSIEDPELMTSLPLTYQNSFGGEGYAANPTGKGFIAKDSADRTDHFFLPNIEYPGYLVSSPADRPPPAGVGPLDQTWEQRAARAGTYDDNWLKNDFPGPAADLDWKFYNAAPSDQWLDGFFQGDETFLLENMHAEKPLLQGRLPAIRARSFINRLIDDKPVFQEVPTNLDTVWLFPAEERGALIYRGVIEVADPDAEDVLLQLIAYEALKDPVRPVEHYKTVMDKRQDEKRGQYHLLDETPLLPAGEKSALVELMTKSDAGTPEDEGFLAKNLKKRAERAREEAEEKMISLGIEPDDTLLQEPADVPEITIENIDDFIENIENLEQRTEQEKREGEKLAREKLASLGLDFEQIQAQTDGKGGRPDLGVSEKIALLEEFALAEPDVVKRLYESQEKSDQAYRQFGHYFPAAAKTEEKERRQKRELVIDGLANGASFCGVDLTGADLSRLDLRGCDFSNAFLEGVDLSDSDLSQANLAGCALMRSTLHRTVFASADMLEANLGQVECREARFADAQMRGCIFYQARLEDTILENCTVEDADFSEASLVGCDITGSVFDRGRFIESRFERLAAHNASCKEALFLKGKWLDIDFSGARLQAAAMVDVVVEKAVFHRADLTSLRTASATSFIGCDFREAVLIEATLRDIDCSQANFSNSDLTDADFGKCRLQQADLRGAIARNTQFVKADLTAASMAGINLCEGSLQQACLHETDLHGANLYAVDFIQAKFRNTNISGANRNRAFLERWIKK